MIEELYLAGFMDGEGSISVFKQRSNYTIFVQVGNTNLEILELIQKDYGGHICKRKMKNSGNRKIQYNLAWNKKEGRELLSKISDKLIIKKFHAELALTLPVKSLTKEEKELSELIYQMLKILNRRGVH